MTALTTWPTLLTESQKAIRAGQVTGRSTLLALFSRPLLFLAAQLLFWLIFLAAGVDQPWNRSAGWWPLSVVLANLASLAFLTRRYRQEGTTFAQTYRFQRFNWKQDLLPVILLFVIAGPVSMIPNTLLATSLFGDPAGPLPWFAQPLPAWALVLSAVLFPLTNGLTEMSTYYGYTLPRLEALTGKPWLALPLTAFVHGLQHMFLPLVFDARFILWRLFMFIPLALLMALAIRWRPRWLPYIMVGHGLLDLSIFSLWLM